jgi:hypothetical protein
MNDKTQPDTARKVFTAPVLERHEPLPVLTFDQTTGGGGGSGGGGGRGSRTTGGVTSGLATKILS